MNRYFVSDWRFLMWFKDYIIFFVKLGDKEEFVSYEEVIISKNWWRVIVEEVSFIYKNKI